MTLLEAFDELFSKFRPCFKRPETYERAYALAYSHLITFGKHMVTRMICSKNEQQKDWSADYKFFSTRSWEAEELAFAVLKECEGQSQWYQDAILTAMDETFKKKTGKSIPGVRTLRDPMSLPFHTNLMPALRFLQVSAIINPQNRVDTARSIPIYLEEAAPAKRPKKNAPDKVKEQFKIEQKEKRISVKGHAAVLKMRQQIDKLPEPKRALFVTVDGSFCNKNFLRDLPATIIPIARARKDLKLFQPFDKAGSKGRGRHRVYGDQLPTPDQMRKDENYPWQTEQIYAAGKYHELRYKTIAPVLWKTGTGREPYRLIVIAPLRYRKSKTSKLLYRDPAYLLIRDAEVPIKHLLQYYFLRWDIEVNHRDEKDLMGMGDAQVRSPLSVKRNSQFSAIVYSLLLLASIKAYGVERTADYLPLPKWRKHVVRRPSTLDILAQFRREVMIRQLHKDLQENVFIQKKTKKRRKPRSRIEAKKRGFINDENTEPKPLKLPVNIISALLYAYC
jgi:hypothetical protein